MHYDLILYLKKSTRKGYVGLKFKLSILFILIFLGIFLSISFIRFYNNINSYNNPNGTLVEGIAVLTGGKGRIAKGIKLFKSSPGSYLIISGVDKNIKNIDIVPKELLKNNRVFIDRKSETTIDNAEAIIKWAKQYRIGNIRIITSDYHMPRSMLILLRQSKSLNFYADPVISDIHSRDTWVNNSKLLIFLIEEYLKFLFCYLVL